MVFQPKISLELIFPDHTNLVESDSESVTSTIPTKNQNKPSKIDQLGPFIDNTGFHLVTNSGNTQPKIKISTPTPPNPIQYPQEVIRNDPPGKYQEGTHPTALKPVTTTVNKPQRYQNQNPPDYKGLCFLTVHVRLVRIIHLREFIFSRYYLTAHFFQLQPKLHYIK